MLRAVLRGGRSLASSLVRPAAAAPSLLRESVRHATTSNHRVAVRIGDKISQKAGYSYKKGMLRNMLTSLIEHERIKTTVARAKKLVRLSDKMVTLGKRGDLGAHRLAAKQLRTKYTLTKLFTIFAERYRERQGGYTRVLKTYNRLGDNAPMAYVEMVDRPLQRMPQPLPEAPGSVMPGRGGRSFRAGKRVMNDEIR